MSIPAKKRKHLKKRKNNNLLKIKRILNTEISAKWGPGFRFSLPAGGTPLAPQSVTPLYTGILNNK